MKRFAEKLVRPSNTSAPKDVCALEVLRAATTAEGMPIEWALDRIRPDENRDFGGPQA